MTVGKIRNDANDAWIELTGGPPDPTDTNWCHDTDTLAEDSASHCATQQSIKAYIDNRGAGWAYIGGGSITGTSGYDLAIDTDYHQILVQFWHLSMSAANCPVVLQLKNAGGAVIAAYVSAGARLNTAVENRTTCFVTMTAANWDAAEVGYGFFRVYRNTKTGTIWNCESQGCMTSDPWSAAGYLSVALTGIRLRPYIAGATFDGSSVVYVWGIKG